MPCLLQQLLACLNFTLDEIYAVGTNEKCLYELWQKHKQLKTMEINKAYNYN